MSSVALVQKSGCWTRGKKAAGLRLLLLLRRLLEIPKVGRRLILPGRHQKAVTVNVVVFPADNDVMIVFVAVVLEPFDLAFAPVALVHGPGVGEGVVDDRDDVVHEVGVLLIERNLLLHDG